jgi:predicted transcriptional regulator of viral defense system
MARARATLTAAQAHANGIPNAYLRRLTARGELEQVARGVYRLAGEAPLDHRHGLALVALRSQNVVISLLSALSFHGLATQLPAEVWCTIGPKDRAPHLDWPRTRVTRMSGAALTSGVEKFVIEGVVVRVFSPAKTVVDLFKFRNKVGLDIALEALRAFRRNHRGKADELQRYAEVCRMERVMRPYLEAFST